MKRLSTALALFLTVLLSTTGTSVAENRGNCHNFVTTAGASGSWIMTASGGYVHDSSTVCNLVVSFEDNSAIMSVDGAQVLLENRDILRHAGAEGFSVIGFASTDGDEEANQALSEQRAEAVKAFLISLSIDADLPYPVFGLGETEDYGPQPEDNRIVILSFNG